VQLSGIDRHILIWDLGTASQVCELKGHKDTIFQLAFSRDGTILASGGGDNCVKLWDASNFEETAKSMDSSKRWVKTYIGNL
jgi:transcription initiation factor TFIID subunit 5